MDTAFSAEITHAEGGVVTLSLVGDLGLRESEQLERRTMSILALSPAQLVIDFAGLKFISSLGMGVLITIIRAVKSHGGSSVILNPQPAVAEALGRCRMGDLAPIEHGSAR